MVKILNSEDVYRRFVEDADEDWLFGLVTFAIVEEQRIEWMKHNEQLNNRAPNAEQIQKWYEEQPSGVFLRAKGTAENALQAYAADVLEEVLETERREVAESTIVEEIRLARRFWPQFGLNVGAGFASAVLFAAVLAVLAFIVLRDPSPVELGKSIVEHPTRKSENGETENKSRIGE